MKKRAFEERVVYQIYPMSFKDSNNDGIGDINGIISKLDYLKDLGIGIIWLSPIYKSPFKDNGYDISDYYEINPQFGTMEDFDRLILEAKKRDILIVMDLVINHTSDQHKWFQEALKDKDSKYRDYYHFKEGKNGKLPNNWTSCFTGPAWEKVPNEENMYYLHLFTKEQVDLNYKNREVIEEIKKIIKFYLDKGVYGFRCDVINKIYKTSLENGKHRLYDIGKEFYQDQEGGYQVLEEIRRDVLDNYDCFLVGETMGLTKETGNKYLQRRCLDMFFEFDHVFCDQNSLAPIFKKKFKAKNLIRPIFEWQESVPWIANYLENHDQRRSVTRYGDTERYYNLSSKALAMFLLTLRGTPFIYQGEEIGMCDYKDLKYEETNDCSALTVTDTVSKMLHISREKAFNMVNNTVNRDHARSPFQWDDSKNAGFNDGAKPWLKVNSSYLEKINVKDQALIPDSILSFYKKMIKVRNNSEILKFGEFKRVKSNKNIAKFERIYKDKKLLIVINLSSKKVKDVREDNNILISNYINHSLNFLQPYEGIIYEIKE